MEEEGEVHWRGPLVLCPFGGEGYRCVDDPFGLDLHQQFGAHLVDGFIWPHDRKEEVSNLNKPSAFLNKGTFCTEEAVAWSRLATFDASSQFSHRHCPGWRWSSHGLHPFVSCGSRHRRVSAAQTLRSASRMTLGGASHHEISSARTLVYYCFTKAKQTGRPASSADIAIS
jgi:hypothetical protein